MERPPEFVDIHCHLLPGLDDGAGSWEETLAMARTAVADGIAAIVATPHQLGCHAANDGHEIRARTERLRTLLGQHRIPLEVLPGADVRIEPDLIAKIRSGAVVTLADRGRHVLLELPHEVYLPLDRLLSELAATGLTGILSHPERNLGIMARPEAVKSLVRAGCLIQVTAESLTGGFGTRARTVGESLVRQGLVHFVSTDAHGPVSRPPLLRRAFQRVVEIAGPGRAEELFCTNPEDVAAGRRVAPGPRRVSKPARFGWLPWSKAG